MLCLYTGIRVGELCGLQWDDIDLASGVMRIRRTVQRIQSDAADSKTALVYSAPKSNTSARTIPLPAMLIVLLQRHRSRRDCDFVLSHNGNPVEPRNVQHHFKRLLGIADIKDVGFHATRHTFATRALESGFDVKTLSEILGHANATITLKQYAHSATEHKRSCMESLSRLWVSDAELGQNRGQHDEKPTRFSG
jgi:integrase